MHFIVRQIDLLDLAIREHVLTRTTVRVHGGVSGDVPRDRLAAKPCMLAFVLPQTEERSSSGRAIRRSLARCCWRTTWACAEVKECLQRHMRHSIGHAA